MLRNYLQTTFRNLWKNRVYSFINIFGLAVGITASILLLLWVQDELSFDRFHAKADHIYQVEATAALAPFASREIPEVQQAVRVTQNWDVYLFTYGEKKFTENKCAYVDAGFFTLFDFPLIQGDSLKPFPNTQSIVITQSAAKKYFGNENPVGKLIQTDGTGNYVVSGIIKDIPANSSIQYDFFFSFEKLIHGYQSNVYWKSLETDWGNFGYDTYFLLRSDASPEAVSKKLTQLQRNNNPYDFGTVFSLRALPNMHLTDASGNDEALQLVQIFFVVAVVILLIACINYMNLATARATKRAKEVGIRKIVGASRVQVFGQFLGESALIVAAALVLALLLIHLLIPAYNELTGKELVLNVFHPAMLVILILTTVGALLAAGIYPALLLSSFQPIQVMKGKLQIGQESISFRKILVVTQFAFSIALIISTLIISSQLDFIRGKQLGYNKENVFMFGMRGEMGKNFESIKTELMQQPAISAVTASNGNLLSFGRSTGDTDWDGKAPKSTFVINTMVVEENFMDVFNMQLAAGIGFTGSKADSTHYILNETAVRQMGLKDPVGKRFKLWLTEGTIIGVAKDFHFRSVHQKIEPAVFLYRPEWNWQLYVKTTSQNASKAIAATEKVWKQYNPLYPFEYTFMDESFDAMYKSDQRTGKLFNYFAAIAILISCLGLFGLSAFTAQQRIKEIGIRKVLGASVSNIALLLSADFLKLVLLSMLIAVPIAWYTMHQWLQTFAYKVTITLWVFLLAGIVALVIALVTMSYQSIKSALANPVKSLRSE